MPRRPVATKQAIENAIASAKAHGLAITAVTVDGTKISILTTPAEDAGTESTADLDRELEAFEARHGRQN